MVRINDLNMGEYVRFQEDNNYQASEISNRRCEFDSGCTDDIVIFSADKPVKRQKSKRWISVRVFEPDEEPVIILCFENMIMTGNNSPFYILLSGKNNFEKVRSENLRVILLTIKNEFKGRKINVEKLKNKLPENRTWIIGELQKTLKQESE